MSTIQNTYLLGDWLINDIVHSLARMTSLIPIIPTNF